MRSMLAWHTVAHCSALREDKGVISACFDAMPQYITWLNLSTGRLWMWVQMHGKTLVCGFALVIALFFENRWLKLLHIAKKTYLRGQQYALNCMTPCLVK